MVPQAAVLAYSVLCSDQRCPTSDVFGGRHLQTAVKPAIRPPLFLLDHPDLLGRPKFIHCGSHWNIQISNAKPGRIRYLWSTNLRLPENAGRPVFF